MELLLENEFWNKIEQNKLQYDAYEQYIYNENYLNGSSSNDNLYEYNNNLFVYSFSAKSYDLYDPIFFQNMLDGNVEKDVYYQYEQKVFDFICSFYQNDCYTYFFGEKLGNIAPYRDFPAPVKSENYFNKNLDEGIIKLDSYFGDFLFLLLREVYHCDLIFVKSHIIIQLSGLHGHLISGKCLNRNDEKMFFEYLEEFQKYKNTD